MKWNYYNLWYVTFIFLLLFPVVPNIQFVNAATTSQLTVTTQDLNNAAITGIYIQLFQNGIQVAAGYSPATFTLISGQMYTVVVNNYLTNMFDHWLDTGSTNNQRDISLSSDSTITAVYKTASSTVTVAPRPPTGLAATTESSTQINLSWAAPTDNGGSAITGYNIYRGTTSNGEGTTPVGKVSNSTLTYTDTGLTNNITYYYKVTAVNSVGESAQSSEASATTFTIPQSPTGLTATAASSSQINLYWTAPSNNGGSSITGYEIERSTNAGTTWSSIVPNTGTTGTTYSDTGLTASTAYTYRVSAINGVGPSEPSNTASATTPAGSNTTIPGSPTGLTATAASSSQINLSWTAPSNNGGSSITGYEIERSTNGGTDWTFSTNIGNTTSYSDTGLTASTAYTYRVSAINGVGPSAPSNTTSATTMAPCTTCQLTVTTQQDTGQSITGMYVELDQNGQKVSSSFSPATFTLTGGTQYTVRVGNFNSYVFDHWLDTGSTINPRPISISDNTQITGVYVDTALTLSPSSGPVGKTVSMAGSTFSSLHTITITWDGSTLATNPSVITSNLTGGFQATFQVPTSTIGSHKVQATDGTNTHSTLFTISSLTFTAPQPPAGLIATAGNTQASLSWAAPTDNGGSAITGYNIYRGTTSNGESATPVGTVSSSTLSYEDTGLTNGQTYYYKVTAVNSIGASSPSNEASATAAIPNASGITVYAHRIPAGYWAPCFATSCSAGTGPGAKMTVALLDSSGNVLQSGLTDENGYTFTGLSSGATYYVYPEDCDSCHISSHDVVFQYWGDNHSTGRPRAAAVGASLDAWYSCTNGCAGIGG